MGKSVPYWKLSGFYFFYFASLGVLIPYWSLYLKSLGYSSLVIGSLVAILPATNLIAPYIWGWLADHTRRSMLIIRVASIPLHAYFVISARAGSMNIMRLLLRMNGA